MRDSINGEYEAAVAAAAFAVASLDEESYLNTKSPNGQYRVTAKPKRDESMKKPTDFGGISRWFSGKDTKDDVKVSGATSLGKQVTFKQRTEEESLADQRPRKGIDTVPSIKRTSTSRKPPIPEHLQMEASQQTPSKFRTTNSTVGGSKVDKWEEKKLAKIRSRYEQTKITILDWENEKKVKAKRQRDRKQRELEEKQARIQQEYGDEISRIRKIAEEARAVAEDRKRNDEMKVREKARKLESTGDVPSGCCGF